MSRRDIRLYLRQMLDYAREAYELGGKRPWSEVVEDRILNLALVRLLEIIGEAAGRVPSEDRSRITRIPRVEIIGLRNRLIHGYDAVDFDILRQIITRDLPPLITALEEALQTN